MPRIEFQMAFRGLEDRLDAPPQAVDAEGLRQVREPVQAPLHQRTRASSHGKRALALGGAKNHLIVTPEYLRKMTTEHPDVGIYAIRLDRGLSPPEILATVPTPAQEGA